MVHKILGWCLGYLLICLPGERADRFANLCRSHGIVLWNLCWKPDTGIVYGCISRKDYNRLKPIEEKMGIVPEVKAYFGGYYCLKRAVARGSFWCGVFLFCLILFGLSTRVWGIEVEGNSYHSRESVLRYLESEGIYGGMAASRVVCSEVEEKIRTHFEDVGWASIEKVGSKLYVRMEEVNLVQPEEEKTPGNLVAEQTGTVVSIVTRTGTAKVRAGDKVKAGKVLISGKVKVVGDNDVVVARKRVHAEGEVVLQCQYDYRDSVPKVWQQKKYTGRSRTIYQLQLGGKNLFYYNPVKSLETYEKYDIIREGGRLCPFLSLRFPVGIWKKIFLETEYQSAKRTPAQAKKLLQERFDYYLEQMSRQGCYDCEGELVVTESGAEYVAEVSVRYLKKQDTYQAISALAGRKNDTKQGED